MEALLPYLQIAGVFVLALVVGAVVIAIFERHPGDPYSDLPDGNGLIDDDEPYTTTQGRRIPPRPPRNPNHFDRNRNAARAADTAGPPNQRS